MEEAKKSTAKCNSWPVPVITETCSAPLRQDSSKELLISIIEERRSKLSKPVASKPQICKAPQLLRRDEKSAKSFDPELVAIGPYHRDKTHLQPAEDHKRTAAAKFTLDFCISEFYHKIKDVADEARNCYADSFDLTDQDFIHMLFFDGCFLLHFIDCFGARDKMEEVPMSTHLHGFILRDMFLLENQLPYVVLDALMSLKKVDLDKFFEKIIGTKFKTPPFPGRTPYHLLDLLRTNFLGPTKWQPLNQGPLHLHMFRSVKELRDVGIKFQWSKTNHLSDIHFSPCLVWGKLSLPRIVVDDLTRSRFLNMIALEMSPGSTDGYGVTSFVCLLDCLIDRAKDVRELRENEILVNALGSDNEVAELFNDLTTNLAPDFKAYGRVMGEIGKHRRNKIKVLVYQFLRSSPQMVINYIAGRFR